MERRKQSLTEEVSSTRRTFCSPDFSRQFWGKVFGEDKLKTSSKNLISKATWKEQKDLDRSKKGENQSSPHSPPPMGLLIWARNMK